MELNKDSFYIYFGFLLINKVNKVPNFLNIMSNYFFIVLIFGYLKFTKKLWNALKYLLIHVHLLNI